MGTELLSEKYAAAMDGTLNCFDRVVLTGSLQSLCYAQGMTSYLYSQGIRIFDYAQFTQPLHEQICAHSEAIAQANGLEIEYIRKKDFRKEDRIQAILKHRGEQPGVVHIFSALEPCPSYRPWHNKTTGRTYLLRDSGKCLHYYFYFIHEQLGLCYLRVPTWCPFRLQFYFNGHGWLANQLKQKGVAFELLDNAFAHIDDYSIANQLVQSRQLLMAGQPGGEEESFRSIWRQQGSWRVHNRPRRHLPEFDHGGITGNVSWQQAPADRWRFGRLFA
jgi:hypothetical protein